jgi:hypothetical protein
LALCAILGVFCKTHPELYPQWDLVLDESFLRAVDVTTSTMMCFTNIHSYFINAFRINVDLEYGLNVMTRITKLVMERQMNDYAWLEAMGLMKTVVEVMLDETPLPDLKTWVQLVLQESDRLRSEDCDMNYCESLYTYILSDMYRILVAASKMKNDMSPFAQFCGMFLHNQQGFEYKDEMNVLQMELECVGTMTLYVGKNQIASCVGEFNMVTVNGIIQKGLISPNQEIQQTAAYITTIK